MSKNRFAMLLEWARKIEQGDKWNLGYILGFVNATDIHNDCKVHYVKSVAYARYSGISA
jgi:hypothetical protein